MLGVKFMDQANSCLPTIWCQVGSKQVQLVRMTRLTFNALWAEANTQQYQIALQNLMKFDFVRQVSVQVQHLIAHERGKTVFFKPGTLVMQHHVRSPWNVEGYRIYRHSKPLINTLEEQASKNPNSVGPGFTSIEEAASGKVASNQQLDVNRRSTQKKCSAFQTMIQGMHLRDNPLKNTHTNLENSLSKHGLDN